MAIPESLHSELADFHTQAQRVKQRKHKDNPKVWSVDDLPAIAEEICFPQRDHRSRNDSHVNHFVPRDFPTAAGKSLVIELVHGQLKITCDVFGSGSPLWYEDFSIKENFHNGSELLKVDSFFVTFKINTMKDT
jgi:hypothetical protein